MATASVTSKTSTSATIKISGLSKEFTTANGFKLAGLTTEDFANMATSIDSEQIVKEKSAGTSGSTTVSISVSGLSPSTSYKWYAYTKDNTSGRYYEAGSVSFTTDAAATTTYTLTVKYRKAGTTTSISGVSDTKISVAKGDTVYPDQIARISISGYFFSYAAKSSITITSNTTTYLYYEPYTNSSLDQSNVSVSTTSITIPIKTASQWNTTCYDHIEIIDTATNKVTTITPSSSNGTSTSVSGTVEGLSKNTTYTFRCKVVLPKDSNEKVNSYYIGSSDGKVSGATTITATTLSDTVYYTLTYKCVNRHDTSFKVRDDYIKTVPSGTNIPDTKTYAPTVTGWTIYSCEDPSIDSVNSDTTITAKYEKKVTATIQYYKNGSLVTTDTKNISPLVGGELDLSKTDYKNNYESSGYYFRYIIITSGNSDTKYETPPNEYEVPNNNITIKYYYVSLCQVTTKHYINNEWQDDDLTFYVDYGHSTTPATWSQIKTDGNYSDCQFSHVVMGSTTYNAGSTTDTYTFTGDVTCKFYYTRATVQYNLTYKYINYYNTEKSVADTYTTSVASGTQISITKDNAPTIDGWEFKSCKPSSPFSVSADTEIILYYAKYVTLTLQYYKDGQLAETADPKQAGYQGPFTPTHSDWRKDNETSYSNYTFQYAEIDGTKYYSTDEKYEIPDHDVVVKYYYTQTSGNDEAQLRIRYLEEDTEQELADPYENFNLDWNSATFGNSVDLSATNSSTGAYVYRKDIDGYTFSRYDLGDYPRPEKSDPYYKENAVYFTSPDLYEVAIYYKKATSGYGATIKINYLELGTNNVLVDPYQKANLAWNSKTWDNRVDLYGIDEKTGKPAYIKEIEGYTCVDYSVGSYDRPLESDPKYIATAVYFRAKTDYEAALYYAKKATTINITTEHICDDDGTVFWTDPNSPYTGVIGFTYAPAHTNYRYPGLDYVFQYAQIQGKDIQYTHPDSSIPVTADTGDLHVVYHYTRAKEASFYVSNVTSNSFELTVELTKPFTSDNYRRLIFTETPGGYSTAFLAWTVDEAVTAGNTSNIQTVGTDKNGGVLDGTVHPQYIVYCYAQAKNGEYYLVHAINAEGITSDYAVVNLLGTNVADGVYGKWCALFNTPAYMWNNNSVDFEITFTETYPFCSQYFTEVGIVQEEFIVPSEALPGIPLVSTPATDMQTTVVQMSITGLLSGTLQSAYFYVQTLDGMYVPIPFGIDGAYGKVTATKPDMLYYNNVPTTGQPVNLLASDIHTFIDAVDRTARWVFDSTEEAYVTRSSVAQGEPIYASTFNGFASFIDSVSGSVSFESAFQYVNAGDCITASNLNALPEALNNMLGVL